MTQAMAHIREHLKDDLQISDVSDAAGVNARALQLLLKKYLRMTPIHYLRAMRLAEFRRELNDMRRSDAGTLTQSAQKWEFNHLGRFSVYCRKMYHENPSDTLR